MAALGPRGADTHGKGHTWRGTLRGIRAGPRATLRAGCQVLVVWFCEEEMEPVAGGRVPAARCPSEEGLWARLLCL